MLIPQYRTRTLLLQMKLNMEVNFIDIHVDTLPGTRQGRDWLTVDHTVRSIPQAPERYYQQYPTNHNKDNVRLKLFEIKRNTGKNIMTVLMT